MLSRKDRPAPSFGPVLCIRSKLTPTLEQAIRECTCEALPQAEGKKLHTILHQSYKLRLLCIDKCLTLTRTYTYLIKLSLMSVLFPKYHPRIVAAQKASREKKNSSHRIWSKEYYLSGNVHAVGCQVGEHQHQLAHQCSCENFHTYIKCEVQT